jgi:hypothetical protein
MLCIGDELGVAEKHFRIPECSWLSNMSDAPPMTMIYIEI